MPKRNIAPALGLLLLFAIAPASEAPLEPIPGLKPPRTDPALMPIIERVDPLRNGWDSEVFSEAAEGQLAELGRLLSTGRPIHAAALERLASSDFECGALRPVLQIVFGDTALNVERSAGRGEAAPAGARRDRGTGGLARALADLSAPLSNASNIKVEFILHSVDVTARTAVTRADLQMSGRTAAGVVEITTTWSSRWVRPPDTAPLLSSIDVERYEQVTGGSGSGPLFSDVTESALGANASFRDLLRPGVDHWLGRLEGWIESDGFGHHGIAVGDIDGDGLEDLYVCQMGGLPNLLYRQNEDGTLTDVSAESGTDWLERTRSALFVDLDNDGDQDLVAATSVSLLFMSNDGKGRFTVVDSISAGETLAPSSGVAVGGDQAGGHYHRGPDLGGVRTSDLVMIAAADYDGDGDLDIYACTYHSSSEEADQFPLPNPYHDANNGGANILLRNDGAWKFTDATRQAGLDVNNHRFSFAASWEDYDNDGDPDLYVANDFGRNNLYRNDGGRFTDVAGKSGVEDIAAGMSVSWADYDNDGWMDLYVGNMFSAAGSRIARQKEFKPGSSDAIRSAYRHHAQGNSLYRNAADGTFRDVSLDAGVNQGRWAWSSNFIDLNNDGLEDLLVANGYFTRKDSRDLSGFFWRQVAMESPDERVDPSTEPEYSAAWKALGRMIRLGGSLAGRERNCAFLNTGGPRFATVSAATGLDFADDARAIAPVDWDLDGDLDVWIANRTGPRLRLALNGLRDRSPHPRKDFVAVKLAGVRSNRDAVGARVELRLAGSPRRRIIRTLHAGDGYLAQGSKWIHFGLGDSTVQERIEKLVVRWPGGKSEEFPGVQAGGRYRIVEGSGRVEAWPSSPRTLRLSAGESAPETPVEQARIFLSAPVPAPALSFEGTEIEGPVLLNLGSSQCAACKSELAELARREPELKNKGIRILALSVDGGDVVAPPDLIDKLQLLLNRVVTLPRPLVLPSSFLIDADGLLGAIYVGPIPLDALPGDLDALRTSGERRLSRAIPYPGRRQTRGWPSFFDYMDQVAQVYVEGGYPEEAVDYYRKVLRIKPGRVQAHFSLAGALAVQGNLDEAISHYRKALEIDADNVSALTNLGAALAERGEIEQAVASYGRALEIDPHNAPALNNLAVALARQGKDDEAITHYRRLLEIEPGNVPAHLNLGMALLRQGNQSEAVHHLTGALRLDPDRPESHYHLGMALLGQGKTKDAINHLSEAVRLKRGYTRALYQLSLALARDRRIDEAVARLGEAMQLPYGSAAAAERLTWILATSSDDSLRDGAEAVRLAEKLCETTGCGNPAALDTLAAAYAEAGRFPQAIEAARKAARLAASAGDQARAAEIQQRLRLYESARPFREKPQ